MVIYPGQPTYRDLRDKLNTLSDNELDCTITVKIGDEYFPAKLMFNGDIDILDDGHPIIVPNEPIRSRIA